MFNQTSIIIAKIVDVIKWGQKFELQVKGL